MKKYWYLSFVLVSILFLFSCDNMFPLPYVRYNPLDDESQLGNFKAVVSGAQSIYTAWEWKSPSSTLSDSRVIDKIRIVHAEDRPPSSAFPSNSGDVEEFTTNSQWYVEWEDLKTNTTHYFSLYAHERGGGWLKYPETVQAYINYYGYEDSNSSDYSWQYMWVDSSASSNLVDSTATNISDGPPRIIGFMRFDCFFDNPDFGAILNAEIQNFTVSTSGSVLFVPLRKKVESGMSWGEIEHAFDYDHAFSETVTSGTQKIQLVSVLNRSRFYGSNTIAIVPTDGSSADIDISTTTFQDSGAFLLTAWRNY